MGKNIVYYVYVCVRVCVCWRRRGATALRAWRRRRGIKITATCLDDARETNRSINIRSWTHSACQNVPDRPRPVPDSRNGAQGESTRDALCLRTAFCLRTSGGSCQEHKNMKAKQLCIGRGLVYVCGYLHDNMTNMTHIHFMSAKVFKSKADELWWHQICQACSSSS